MAFGLAWPPFAALLGVATLALVLYWLGCSRVEAVITATFVGYVALTLHASLSGSHCREGAPPNLVLQRTRPAATVPALRENVGAAPFPHTYPR